jgi:beta-glucanase (GH16 family)
MNFIVYTSLGKCKDLLLLFFAFSLIFSKGVSAQQSNSPACPMGEQWIFSPQFSDEFDDDNLDKEKWMDLVPVWYGRKHTRALFSEDNVVVRDGTLQLICDLQQKEEVTYANKIRGFDKYNIAIIKSRDRIRYGYFEARCKSMRANVCNAFFLYDPLNPPAKYLPGKFSEEIDIFEIIGKPTPELRKDKERIYSTTVHRFETPYLEGVVNLNRLPLPNQSAKQRVPFDFFEDYHVYGFLWTPTEMKWFIDGVEVFSRENDYFKAGLYIVFDCETLWGEPDAVDLPATFYVDYIRIWQQEDNYPLIKGL